MANLIVSGRCTCSCGYCFARQLWDPDAGTTAFMSRATFYQALDFLDRSGVEQVRLLGGEPTLHPEFLDLVRIALERHKPIRIFSNGSLGPSVLDALDRIAEAHLGFVINATAEGLPGGASTLDGVLGRLGKRAMLGINISRPSLDLVTSPGTGAAVLFDWIDRHHLQRTVRVGVAHPCVGFDSVYVPPSHYPAVGRILFELARQAAARSITLHFDCGIVPCMVPQLVDSDLWDTTRPMMGHCGPVLDILPDGSIVPCFPLARVASEPLTDTIDAASLRDRFRKRLRSGSELGVTKICRVCRFKQAGQCSGGCAAAALLRTRPAHFELRVGPA